MTSNFNTTANSINNIALLGFQLGALGLAVNFAGRMIDSTQPRRKKRAYDYFDYDMSYKKPQKKQNIFNWDYGF